MEVLVATAVMLCRRDGGRGGWVSGKVGLGAVEGGLAI